MPDFSQHRVKPAPAARALPVTVPPKKEAQAAKPTPVSKPSMDSGTRPRLRQIMEEVAAERKASPPTYKLKTPAAISGARG